jgi:hypothetical protein
MVHPQVQGGKKNTCNQYGKKEVIPKGQVLFAFIKIGVAGYVPPQRIEIHCPVLFVKEDENRFGEPSEMPPQAPAQNCTMQNPSGLCNTGSLKNVGELEWPYATEPA